MRTLATALRLTVLLTFLVGIVYPLAVMAVGRVLFAVQARGSLVVRGGKVVGSSLIGQSFTSPRYFHGRPSAAGSGNGYDAANSGASNLAPTNAALVAAVRARLKAVLAENPGVSASQVPIDLVTASASGLDPEISPQAAGLQVARVARARRLSPEAVRALVQAHTRPRWLGIFGEPGVNLLTLNLALDRLESGTAAGSDERSHRR